MALACLAWAIDNNLTRKVSASDAMFLAAVKGLVAGVANVGIAQTTAAAIPGLETVSASMLVGLLGFGASLVFSVLALRGLGSARTGAYFSTAPFIGATVAVALLHEPVSFVFWLAAACMGAGVWLHPDRAP